MHTQFWISDDVELVCSRGAFDYPLHTHVSMLILNVVRSGQVTVSTHAGIFQYTTGDCFEFMPHIAHRLCRTADSEMLSICYAANHISTEGILNSSQIRIVLADLQKQHFLAKNEAENLTTVVSMMPARIADTLPSNDTITRHVFEFLETHPEAHLPLARLAQKYGRSLWHVIRRFREDTGLTPHQFQMQNRIRQAKQLLRGDASLTDVALSAGFCDQSHLNRCLRRAIGLTPVRYRASCCLAQCREKLGEKA